MDTKERDAAVSPTTPQSGKEANMDSVPAGAEGVKASFLELFERELETHGITWCKGCDSYGGHRRGFATPKTRTVHLDTKMMQRRSLLGGLHEIGHLVANTPNMKRWEREKSATDWAYRRMRELGISIPRKERKEYEAYANRWKKFGKNVLAGRKKSEQTARDLNTALRNWVKGGDL